MSLKRVQRLMRKADIRSIVVKKFRPQRSIGTIEERTNLLGQDFTTTSINEKWVADITYIHTLKDGWCYLASVLDLHSKKIVGYSFSRSIVHSFSRKGCPYDNACIESFHASLKKEEVHQVKYLDYHSAKLALFQFIERWYNRKRIHSQLGFRTPQEVEDQIRQSA